MSYSFIKYILPVFFTLFLFVNIWSQNASDSKGKQGPWKVYHKDGKTVKYIGQFKNDKPVGKFVFYYITGEPSTVIEHKEDGSSECKMYHLNGSLLAVGNYVNQEKEGVWWYFNNQKKVMSKETYANGLLTGVAYEYFPSDPEGKLMVLQEIYYEKGLAQGEWKKYFKDGKIQLKGNYVNGVQQGQCIWYSTSGNAEIYGYYKDGLRHGRWRVIKDDGTEEYVVYRKDVELKGKTAEIFLESLSKQNNK